MNIRIGLPVLLAAILLAGTSFSPLPAQDVQEARRRAEEILGRPLTDQEILRLLQQSGLTPEEVRDRLAREGLPREAADPYLAVLEGRADRVPDGTDPAALVQVLTGVQLTERLGAPEAAEIGPLAAPERGLPFDSAAPEPPSPRGLPVFGRDLFRNATSEFEAPATGPVPPDYRLGPGDEIVLVLTGDVELAYRLTVSREGWIVIPDVGRVPVNGQTLGELQRVLAGRLSRVYSGLTGDTEATTFLDVSIGSIRTNQIFVIGEVERPAAYELSSLTRALGALYWAGGPSDIGSFRRVAVNRGGRTVATVDLYEYLLYGRTAQNVRLEHGDAVFVPVAGRQVEVDGAVMRPGRYELVDGEGLRELLRFAGGLQPNAYLARAQIERVLPVEEQQPGLHRVLLDVPIGTLDEEGGSTTELRDGDRVTIFAVLEELRNTVRISGGVWRPGEYGAEPGLRLWELIDRAGGLLPDVFEGRAQIQRLEPDYTRRMIPVSLARGPDGRRLEDPEILPFDQVLVFAQRNLREERLVSIGGWVREPGVYPFAEGMSVRDLILRAGGLRTGAYLEQADVSRVVIAQSRRDTITQNFTVSLDSSLVFDVSRSGAAPIDGSGGGSAERTGGDRPAADFVLQNLDAVYVRQAPGFTPQRSVTVTGQVMFPGPYSLLTRTERLTELIARAGGLTPEAYAEGLQLWRSEPEEALDTLTALQIAGRAFGDTLRGGMAFPGADTSTAEGEIPAAGEAVAQLPTPRRPTRTRVGVDFLLALRDPGSPHNILIEPNDSIYVPSFIPTVDVRGQVGAPTKVLHREGAGLDYYINRAGGYARDADKGRVRIQFASGEVATRGGKFLFFGGGIPDPDPGSVIFVPRKPPKEGGFTFAQLAALVTSLATAAATIVVVSTR
ncbi:MAG: SLBB domain-containing protein [Gemmatimonadota bacterium]